MLFQTSDVSASGTRFDNGSDATSIDDPVKDTTLRKGERFDLKERKAVK